MNGQWVVGTGKVPATRFLEADVKPQCQCLKCIWAREGRERGKAWLQVLVNAVLDEEASKGALKQQEGAHA